MTPIQPQDELTTVFQAPDRPESYLKFLLYVHLTSGDYPYSLVKEEDIVIFLVSGLKTDYDLLYGTR